MTPPPPLFWTWDFIEMGWPPPTINLGLFWTWDFFKLIDPLKILRNKLNMKNIGTKSINMTDIMVYLVMFSTSINKILCFLGPNNMKILNFSQLKLETYFYLLTLHPPIWTGSKDSPFFSLESFPYIPEFWLAEMYRIPCQHLYQYNQIISVLM